jgi:hypothetical protein
MSNEAFGTETFGHIPNGTVIAIQIYNLNKPQTFFVATKTLVFTDTLVGLVNFYGISNFGHF